MQGLGNLKSALEARIGEDLVRDLPILGCVILLLVFLGPFATGQDLGLLPRTVYWTIAIGTGFLGARGHSRFIKPKLLRRGLGRFAPVLAILSITVSALAAVLVLEAMMREPVPLGSWLLLSGSVLGVSLSTWGIFSFSRGRGTSGAADPSPAFIAFQNRWPASLRTARLHAVAAEDHFVRIITDRGDALVSGRFSEALKAVADQPGVQVHRSWWVADCAVEALARSGGRWRLQLANDVEAPVSRRFRPEVRARGWDRLGR